MNLADGQRSVFVVEVVVVLITVVEVLDEGRVFALSTSPQRRPI